MHDHGGEAADHGRSAVDDDRTVDGEMSRVAAGSVPEGQRAGTPVRDPSVEEHEPRVPAVDPGALVLAGAGVGLTFLTGDGDWGPSGVLVGFTLALIVLAYHQPAPGRGTLRNVVTRQAFGAVLALSVCISLAWPIQEIIIQRGWKSGVPYPNSADSPAGDTSTITVLILWLFMAPLIALREPALTRLLDIPRRQRRDAVSRVVIPTASPPTSPPTSAPRSGDTVPVPPAGPPR